MKILSLQVRSNVLAFLIASLTASASTVAAAQDMGGFINLLGNVIEQDMRNQQQRQRMQREDQYYRQQQQQQQQQQKMMRQAEQAKLNEERRKEVLLIKRLQSAMSKLGFYSSKIDGDRGPGTLAAENLLSTAFELPQLSLTEADLRYVESLAVTGFRSKDEMKRATIGGFRSRDEFLAAEKGGFSTASELAVARADGFSTSDDYQLFKTSGFVSGNEFRLARKGGFTDSSEFETSRSAGFNNRSDYLAFVESKLPDRKAYLAAQEAKEAAKIAVKQCSDGVDNKDITVSLATCIKVISLGVVAPPVHDAFNMIGMRLEQRLAQVAPPISKELKVAAVDGSVEQLDPSAGEFLAEYATLQDMSRKHACGVSILSKDWETAKTKCASVAGSSDVIIDALHAKAVQEAALAQREAEKDTERKRAEAQAEQDRLSLASAQDRMSTLIELLSHFTQAKRSLVKPIEVAKAIVRLRQLQTSQDSKAIEQAILQVDELLSVEEDYQKFIREQAQAKEIAAVNAKTTAIAEIYRIEAFIEDYVSRNLLDGAVSELLALQAKLVEARESDQDERVFNGQKLGLKEIQRLGLSSAIAAFVFDAIKPKVKTVEQASNGLAVTNGNRVLLEGDGRDILILGNFTAQAPHLIVNLLGETDFDQATATYCWLGDGSKAPLADQVPSSLHVLGAEKLLPNGVCTPNSVLNNDIVLLPRADFLKINVLEARPVIDAFESNQLKLIQPILWADVGVAADAAAKLAATIRSEVIAGIRPGFGFVTFDNSATSLCMAVPTDHMGLHKRALAINEIALSRHLAPNLELSAVSLDRAFAGVQKNSCRAVYASDTDLVKLLEGLARIQIAHTFLPVWIEPITIAEGEALARKSAEDQAIEITARKQEIEAQIALTKKLGEEVGRQHERAQVAMRARYSQEARAAFNQLSDMSERFLRNTGDISADFSALFPSISQWNTQRQQASWKFDTYNGKLLDYGTAEWKGRRLEAVIVEVSLTTKNPARGEYSNDCFVVGYLIDQEFGVKRDAIEEPCVGSQDTLTTWQVSRNFESRWVAH